MGNRKGVLIAVFAWLIIVGLAGVGVKMWYFPTRQKKLEKQTSSDNHQYKHNLMVALDNFSGYCLLRSGMFQDRLRKLGIKLTCQDDGADYPARIKALKNGDVQFAVFTLDSYIAAGAALGEYPGSIILAIDETKGADAIIGGAGVATLNDLNDPEARIVLTPNSPSEFFARVVASHFNVAISDNYWVKVNGSSEVLKHLKSKDSGKTFYVMWEPDVSRALENKGMKRLLDSSKLEGYIVDILVVQRKFLADNPELVSMVAVEYLRTVYAMQQNPDAMVDLIMKDCADTGQKINREAAATIAKTISWKNTMENYAHFGLLPLEEAKGLPSLEDMISNISKVLVQASGMSSNPLAGKETSVYYDKILADLKDRHFHPGRAISITSLGGEQKEETIRGVNELKVLSPEEWQSIISVGQLRANPIVFGRGKANLGIQGQRDLDEFANNLKAWPDFYLKVIGHASAVGDMDANLALAKKRADAVTEYLISGGVSESRIMANAEKPSGSGADALSVTFILGQLPY